MKQPKVIIFIFFTVILHAVSNGQTDFDNCNSITKAIFLDSENKILLEYQKTSNSFEPPSIKKCYPLKPIMDSFSIKTGLLYKSMWLGGEFEYLDNNKSDTTYVSYYVIPFAGYINDKVLSDTAKFKWFSLDNAVSSTSYPTNGIILKKILSENHIMWTATFLEYGYSLPFDRDKIKYKVINDFKQLKN